MDQTQCRVLCVILTALKLLATTKLREGNIFTGRVILSTMGRGRGRQGTSGPMFLPEIGYLGKVGYLEGVVYREGGGVGYPDGIYLHSRIYPTSQINPFPRNHKGGQYASYWNAYLLILISLTQENSKNATQIQGPNSNELNIGQSRQNANVAVVTK